MGLKVGDFVQMRYGFIRFRNLFSENQKYEVSLIEDGMVWFANCPFWQYPEELMYYGQKKPKFRVIRD